MVARHHPGKRQLGICGVPIRVKILERMAVHAGPLLHLPTPTTQLDRCLARARRDKVHGSAISSVAARR
jgi:hypothetical protein